VLVFQGAGHIDLLAQPEQVFGLNDQQHRRAARQIGVDGGNHGFGEFRQERLILADTLGQQAFALQRPKQSTAIPVALGDKALSQGVAGEEHQAGADIEIDAAPEAGKRRQVVGAGGDKRLARHVGGETKLAVRVAFEHQWMVGQHAGFEQTLAETVRHGAQVFADHQALMVQAFTGDQAEQVVKRVMHIGAFGGRRVGRHPEQPHQTHHMVDAQRAGVLHVGTQDVDERLVADGAQVLWHEGRQTPILAKQIEFVGRGASAGAAVGDGKHGLPGPYLGAAGVGADGQILIQADGHAERLRPCRRRGQLGRSDPLQPGAVIHCIGMYFGKRGDAGGSGIAIVFRPGRPPPGVLRDAEMSLQRFIAGEAGERLALFIAPGGKRLGACAAGLLELIEQ